MLVRQATYGTPVATPAATPEPTPTQEEDYYEEDVSEDDFSLVESDDQSQAEDWPSEPEIGKSPPESRRTGTDAETGPVNDAGTRTGPGASEEEKDDGDDDVVDDRGDGFDETLEKLKAASNILNKVKFFDDGDKGVVRIKDLLKILAESGLTEAELRHPNLLRVIDSCRVTKNSGRGSNPGVAGVRYRKLFNDLGVGVASKREHRRRCQRLSGANLNANAAQNSSGKGNRCYNSFRGDAAAAQLDQWRREVRLNVCTSSDEIGRRFLVHDPTDSGMVDFADFARVFSAFVCPSVSKKLLYRLLRGYGISRFSEKVNYRDFLVGAKSLHNIISTSSLLVTTLVSQESGSRRREGVPEMDLQTIFAADLRTLREKDRDRFMAAVEKLRDRFGAHFHMARQSLLLMDSTGVKTGIVKRDQLKEVVESLCGLAISTQDWLRIMIQAKALAERGRVYYRRVLDYLRQPGVTYIEKKFWVTKRQWQGKLDARPLHLEWTELMKTVRVNLRASLNRVLDALALKQEDGLLYENVTKENIRKVILDFGRINFDDDEFEVFVKFGETPKGTVDYMQLLRNIGVISSHDFGIRAALKRESRIPEGLMQKDGEKSKRGTLPAVDRIKKFYNPRDVRAILVKMDGLGSIWTQFCDEDGIMRTKFFHKFLDECGVLLSSDCYSWLLREMNKSVGDLVGISDVMYFLHKRAPRSFICSEGTYGLAGVHAGGPVQESDISTETLEEKKRKHGFQVLSEEVNKLEEWLEAGKPPPPDPMMRIMEDVDGLGGPEIPNMTKKDRRRLEKAAEIEEEKRKKKLENDLKMEEERKRKARKSMGPPPIREYCEVAALEAMQSVRADVARHHAEILEVAETIDADGKGKMTPFEVERCLDEVGIELEMEDVVDIVKYLRKKLRIARGPTNVDPRKEYFDYLPFFDCLTSGPLTWAQEWEERTTRAREEFDKGMKTHNWPGKPPSTDEAVHEYRNRVAEILKMKRRKAIQPFSEKDHIELRNEIDAMLESMTDIHEADAANGELQVAQQSLEDLQTSLLQLDDLAAKEKAKEVERLKAEENDEDLTFLEDTCLRWSVLLNKLQDATLEGPKFVTREKLADVYRHLGLKLKIPPLTRAYLLQLEIIDEDKIQYEWLLAISLLLKGLRYDQILWAHVHSELSDVRDEFHRIHEIYLEPEELDVVFELVLRMRLMARRNMASFWAIVTINDSKCDFLLRSSEFFKQLHNHGVSIDETLRPFFLHFFDPRGTGFVNYKDFVWTIASVASAPLPIAATLPFPQKAPAAALRAEEEEEERERMRKEAEEGGGWWKEEKELDVVAMDEEDEVGMNINRLVIDAATGMFGGPSPGEEPMSARRSVRFSDTVSMAGQKSLWVKLPSI